jgi:hypothetical protein
MVETTVIGASTMPIKSKKQSQAKQDWMAANSKVYGVRVMNNDNERDLWDFLKAQDSPATTIKIALREYMKNHMEDTTT